MYKFTISHRLRHQNGVHQYIGPSCPQCVDQFFLWCIMHQQNNKRISLPIEDKSICRGAEPFEGVKLWWKERNILDLINKDAFSLGKSRVSGSNSKEYSTLKTTLFLVYNFAFWIKRHHKTVNKSRKYPITGQYWNKSKVRKHWPITIIIETNKTFYSICQRNMQLGFGIWTKHKNAWAMEL